MSTSARKDFPIFDCDSHVVEPPSVRGEYVPAKSRAWIKMQFCFHTDSASSPGSSWRSSPVMYL